MPESNEAERFNQAIKLYEKAVPLESKQNLTEIFRNQKLPDPELNAQALLMAFVLDYAEPDTELGYKMKGQFPFGKQRRDAMGFAIKTLSTPLRDEEKLIEVVSGATIDYYTQRLVYFLAVKQAAGGDSRDITLQQKVEYWRKYAQVPEDKKTEDICQAIQEKIDLKNKFTSLLEAGQSGEIKK